MRTARRTSATPEATTMIQPGVRAPSRSDGRASPRDESTEPTSPPATAIPTAAPSCRAVDVIPAATPARPAGSPLTAVLVMGASPACASRYPPRLLLRSDGVVSERGLVYGCH